MAASISHFSWDEDRCPFQDELKELSRIDRYWVWLNSKTPVDHAEFIVPLQRDYHVVKLQTPEDADYEAKYMKHSIGFNWWHYSSLGNIYSIRSSSNIPIMTCLVAHDEILQARILDNALPGDYEYELLRQFANVLGFQFDSQKN